MKILIVEDDHTLNNGIALSFGNEQMLQLIGMTKRQLQKLLILEGLYYTVGAAFYRRLPALCDDGDSGEAERRRTSERK